MINTDRNNIVRPKGSMNVPPREKPESVDTFKRERDNFRRMKPELEQNPEYTNKFVAVHDNEIVGTSEARLELYLKISKNYTPGTFFIGKVYPPR